jgi:predicted nucleic acid-binding protein
VPDLGQPGRAQYAKPYAESSFFIAWIEGEVVNGIDRGEVGRHILGMAQSGACKVHTSTWTMAEVHKRRHSPQLTADQDEKVLAFFEHDFVELIVLDREVGEAANRIARERGLPPGDAVHVASALRAGCDCLLSWDDGHLVGRTDLGIPVELPRMLGQGSLSLDETTETDA